MFILYDLIFLVITLISLPRYLFRRKFHQGFIRRLGILPRGLNLERPVWIHAVSVGETMAIRGLVEALRQIYPEKQFVISTVTPTGNKIALSIAKEGDFVTYLPLDFSFIVRGVLKRVNPVLFIIAETEIWPNLVSLLSKMKIPIVTVNGRISDASFKGYKAIKPLLKPLLNKINAFCVQSKLDAQRLERLGVIRNKIQVTGNMKFDTKSKVLSFDNLHLGLDEDEELWVCGSTHRGEEEIILGVYRKLLAEFPKLKLLIAPRHPERSKDIESLAFKNGFEGIFLSQLGQATSRGPRSKVFILDTIGQLLNYYAIADIVFVGGSLVKTGGHNIIEPASQAKPIIFGPHMFNFRDIADLFLRNKAALLVRSRQELLSSIKYLMKHPAEMDELGKRAKATITQNQGATLRNAEIIKKTYAGIPL
jgi:3-deoxy-D-manno-octulosonic-acid transferase